MKKRSERSITDSPITAVQSLNSRKYNESHLMCANCIAIPFFKNVLGSSTRAFLCGDGKILCLDCGGGYVNICTRDETAQNSPSSATPVDTDKTPMRTVA